MAKAGIGAWVLGFVILSVDAAVAQVPVARPEPAGPAGFAARQAAWEQHQRLVDSSWFRDLRWRSVGPVIQGGRVVDIEGIPDDPFGFYVAYASGGLWKTTNNGHTFEPVFDDQPTIIMGDAAVAPSDSQVVWVGTGENNSSRSSYGGHGVFRSTDGGKTWQHRGLGDADRIGEIVIDPRDPRRVYVAALGKLYTTGGQRGVFRTIDGGETWENVLPGGAWSGAIEIEQDPHQLDTLYAALWERSRRPWDFVEAGPASGVWKSTDGGTTWARLAGGFPAGPDVGRIGLSLCRTQPQTIYACVDHQELLPEAEWDLGDDALSPKRLRSMTREEFLAHDLETIEDFVRGYDLDTQVDGKTLIQRIEQGDVTLADLVRSLDDANANLFRTDIRGVEVYRSNDGGATWVRTHTEPLRQVVHTYGYYFGFIHVAPDDPDRIYVAGVPILTSSDGGRTFASLAQHDLHVDNHGFWIDPQHPARVILGNDGGLDISYDRGENWRSVDAQPVGQFYTVAVDMEQPYNIYGGTQDNGTLKGSSRSVPGRDPWTFLGGGDGMYVQVDTRDRTVYFGYQFGFYFRRAPDGKVHEVRPRAALGAPALRYNWSTPIQLSSHNQDILYFGTNQLFRSMDQGSTWTAISPDLSRSPQRGDVPFACVTTVSESALAFGLIWTGTDDGYVHVTETGGSTWREATAGLPKDRWVTRVAASRHVRERAYVTLSGYRDDDVSAYVYTTEDLGRTWRSLAASLPAEPINVVLEDPVNPEVLYVGTDRSVYVSIDRGQSWAALAAGLPKVPVHDLVVHPRDRELIAGTHGRSVYVVDVLPIQKLVPELTSSPVAVFPVEPVTYSRGWRGRDSLWFREPEFEPKVTIPFWSATGDAARLEVLDADQRVLASLTREIGPGISTFEWDLCLDPAKALPAEAVRIAAEDAKRRADGKEPDEKGRLGRTPWAEAVRLGHRLYATPGSYTLRVSTDGGTSEVTFEVKPPEEREPRMKPKPALRGEKDED
ncbi:MAG: glycosyl hydrolase [Planctomycetota bacterium]